MERTYHGYCRNVHAQRSPAPPYTPQRSSSLAALQAPLCLGYPFLPSSLGQFSHSFQNLCRWHLHDEETPHPASMTTSGPTRPLVGLPPPPPIALTSGQAAGGHQLRASLKNPTTFAEILHSVLLLSSWLSSSWRAERLSLQFKLIT